MAGNRSGLDESGFIKAWKVSLLSFLALIGIVSADILFGTPDPYTDVVSADQHQTKYEPWLWLNCLKAQVKEGRDFRLEVHTKYDANYFSPTMRVYWYTDPLTADESDYAPLNREKQSSNHHQSEHGIMARDFHTKNDLYSEVDENFIVRFENAVEYGTDGSCRIRIRDDDGVGIHDLEITSVPREMPGLSESEELPVGYTAGDVIELTARLTGPVTNVNPDNGEQADYPSIYMKVGAKCRVAHLLRVEDPKTLVFGYEVKSDDTDGVSVGSRTQGNGMFYMNKETMDTGLWATRTESGAINGIFLGLNDDPGHPVVWHRPPRLTPAIRKGTALCRNTLHPAAWASIPHPKPIPKWDVHFEGLEDYRKDPDTTAADQ